MNTSSLTQSNSPQASVRVRFAPSPTGQLHVGNVRTALYNWLFARQHGGAFLLRIEDTDVERSRPEYEQRIYDDLRWLGLDWDEGPDVGGALGPYRQSERLAVYRRYAERLLQSGDAYHCFCTADELAAERQQAEEAGRRFVYSGRCRTLPPEQVIEKLRHAVSHTIRFKVRSGMVAWDDLVRGHIEWQADLLGDFVIVKSDGWPVYNFAVVVDDIEMKITHVIRGEGHLANTHRQLLLYEALQARPPVFGHLSTILGTDGTKLSKRHGATALAEFRQQGYQPEALLNFLALLGWSPKTEGEILSRDQLIEQFSLDRVVKAPAIFDQEKLNWINREYLKRADRAELVRQSIVYLKQAGRLPDGDLNQHAQEWVSLLLEVTLTYVDTLAQLPQHAAVVLDYDLTRAEQTEEIADVIADPQAIRVLRLLQDELASCQPVTVEAFQAAAQVVKEKTGRKGRALFHPIRVGLTARASGPELVKLIPLFELGAALQLPIPVLSVRERLARFLERYDHSSHAHTNSPEKSDF
ncbi:MAG: glutamate--tRNA ligase [Blastocatellia bacterium]|nr:glutamate--tRNA ligase [Blastocatellia bacterium]